MKFIDITGNKYGRLTVIKRNNKIKTERQIYWDCICSCDNSKIIRIRGSHLKRGLIQSCGCLRSEVVSTRNKKYNTYIKKDDYYIGYTNKGFEFYFDIEDFDLVKERSWYKDDKGYIVNRINGVNTKMHRLVMGATDSDIQIDHKDNKAKHDNRKSNLRKCTHSENQCNKSIQERNKSGVIGVRWKENLKKWAVRITKDRKEVYLGVFEEFELAVKARLIAEIEYFNEFAPQKHLFKEYGVTNNE